MLTANWLWRHCSIQGSHLGALQAEVLKASQALERGRGGVGDSTEVMWTKSKQCDKFECAGLVVTLCAWCFYEAVHMHDSVQACQ